MFHYLFTNDLRISTLDAALKKAGQCFVTDTVPSASIDKSVNNNMMTLGFYFNLWQQNGCARAAARGEVRTVVLNFIKKFQFPNLRTKSGYEECRNDHIILAPMRVIVKVLYTMNLLRKREEAYLTKEEIKYFIFYNEEVAKKKDFDLLSLIEHVVKHRKDGSYPASVSIHESEHEWKQEGRQIGEMLKILQWSGCIAEKDEKYIIENDKLSERNKADIFDIINYNEFWEETTIESYREYMDLDPESTEVFDAGESDIQTMKKETFKIKELPEVFQTDFSRRYITALLAKPFVILTGNSGTGKTRIAKQFAQYLEYRYEKTKEDGSTTEKRNWEIVPVGADWTDNVKVLGFYNPLGNNGEGKYEKTGILELIEEADAHRDIPYFLILDEMNLSHVERYFSDFLSHMEMPDVPFELDGYAGNPEYPKNLFVVGTVNIDETTYMFSPKVLDRANVIEFKPQKDEVIRLFGGTGESGEVTPANDGSAEAFLGLFKEICAGKFAIGEDSPPYYDDEDHTKSNMEYVKDVFSDVYEIVEKNGFEFAFRTVKEIRQYISAAYELAEDTEFQLNQTIDEQLLQKVLPRIHGNKKEIGQLLDDLGELCDNYQLVLSKKKIEQMKGKLAKVQYAGFI